MTTSRTAIVLWTSFCVAFLATVAFYTAFDPMEMHRHGEPLFHSPLAAYSISFFIVWGFAALCAAVAVYFTRPKEEVNGYCPVHTGPAAEMQPESDLQ